MLTEEKQTELKAESERLLCEMERVRNRDGRPDLIASYEQSISRIEEQLDRDGFVPPDRSRPADGHPAHVGETLEESLRRFERLAEEATNRRRDLDAWLLTQPQTLPCPVHPNVHRPVDPDESSRKSYGSPTFVADYVPCAMCIEDEKRRKRNAHWLDRGVPTKLCDATFDQLCYETEEGVENLKTCRQYAKRPCGFLVLNGGCGTGKSHIGCAILRQFGRGFYVTQSDLLTMHRDTYCDSFAPDAKRRATETALLVLDEIGVSVGGRDEGPLLYDILNFRYARKLPTVLISNLEYEAMKDFLGLRIVDRLQEAVFAVLHFRGSSHRAACNDAYLQSTQPDLISVHDV